MIKKELVFINKEFNNKKEVLTYLVHKIKKLNLVSDEETYLKSVMAREEEAPTSMGFEVAIPHGRSDVVEEAFVAYVRVKTPFVWDERNGEKVSSIFLLGVPETGGDRLHLLYLSQISRHLTKETFRNQLKRCTSTDEISEIFEEINVSIYGKGE
jgi:fructose-specific phosphotransferase system IIA component